MMQLRNVSQVSLLIDMTIGNIYRNALTLVVNETRNNNGLCKHMLMAIGTIICENPAKNATGMRKDN